MSNILSIIIPVFNLRCYIEKCVNSIINNIKTTSYEIILINDGSTDGSGIECDKLAEIYPYIKVLHTKNSGVSSARNLGLNLAVGRYICFVDADDQITCDIDLGSKNLEVDFFIFRSFSYNAAKLIKENYYFSEQSVGKVISCNSFFERTGYFRGSVCGVIFSKIFLDNNNLRFGEGIKNGEDTIFMSFCFALGKCFMFLNESFYKVNVRENSANFTDSTSRVFNQLSSLDFIKNNIKSQHINISEHPILRFLIYSIISNTLIRYSHCNDGSLFRISRRIKSFDFFPINTSQIPIKRFKIKLLNLSPILFYYIIKVR